MTGAALAAMLPDGRRLHLQHGPIDLIAEAWGEECARAAALTAASRRFSTVLEELVAELPALRRPLPERGPHGLQGPVARRMARAVAPHAPLFVTPMAAVAGAVADEILFSMTAAAPLARAYVNNGGDAAIHLGPGEEMRAAIAATRQGPMALAGAALIRHSDRPRGIATSGRGGRSLSLGIADAVTALARDAAAADAAATLIANAVDLPGHPAIARVPACALDPDSDLGERLAVTGIGPLSPEEADAALAAGLARAEAMRASGLIEGAALFLAGREAATGALLPLPAPA